MVSRETAQDLTPRATYTAVLLLLSLFAWAPLLYPGYLQLHSGFVPVFNLASLAASSDKLSWLPTIGAGSDLLRGEGPLAYWLALLLRPLAGDVGAIKGVFALSLIAAGLGMAAWARQSLAGPTLLRDITERTGLLAAVVLMLWPPLLATVYVRGALAEALFVALLPWLFWAVAGARTWQGNRETRQEEARSGKRGWGWSVAVVILVAALVWTQAGLAVWAAAVLAAWAVWPGAPRAGRTAAVLAVLAGAALGFVSFWLLHRSLAGAASTPDLAAHAVYPYQLFSAAWNSGISTSDWKNELPLQLGLAATGLAILAAVLSLGPSGSGKAEASSNQEAAENGSEFTIHHSPFPINHSQLVLRFALLLSLILILLTTTLARPLWSLAPLAATLTYPWQLLALVGPLLALLAGSVVVLEHRLALLSAWAGLIALVVLGSYPYLAPKFTQVVPDPAAPAIFGGEKVTLLDVEVVTPSLTLPLRGGGDQTPSSSDGESGQGSVTPSPSEGESGQGSVTPSPSEGESGQGSVTPSPSEGEGWQGSVTPSPSEGEGRQGSVTPSPSEGEGRGGGGTLSITQPLTVTVDWQPLQPVDFDYNVFVHALDQAGNLVAQWDGQPQQAGQPYPMTTWPVGEIVEDAYRLELPAAAATAVRRIDLGLYNWQTGERLPVNGDNKITMEVAP